MALKGTLKDFGIADIFQLIGQQTKTGVLHLKSRDEEVHIAFSNGAIVRADSASRRQRDLLGAMLLNGGFIGQGQLDESLEVQRRTLQRLGDILIEKRFVRAAQLKEMYQLQLTETVYRLFGWKTGTYEFEQGAVEFDAEMITPIRSESVLMEGFRRVDEWPSIRRVISSPNVTFEQLKRPLDPEPGAIDDSGASDDDLDAAFGEPSHRPHRQGDGPALSSAERRVYSLAQPGVTAEQIGDRSRLGEFESHKALLNLINSGYLKVQAGVQTVTGEHARVVLQVKDRAVRWTTFVLVTLLVVGVIGLLAYLLDAQRIGGGDRAQLADATAQHLLGSVQRQRLAEALAVYRLEKGSYPNDLDELARSGLVRKDDLSYPFDTPFFYRRTPEGTYQLLPPIQ
jgi:Domain of unknown function (DUF4388)